MIWQLFFLFLLGLAVGSFLNVLIYRLCSEKAPKFWQGRSICPKCKHPLSITDNVPLLSFFLLKGRCRYCRRLISWQYPVVEVAAALVTVAVWFYSGQVSPTSGGFNLSFIIYHLSFLLIAYSFIVIFFSDYLYGLIPDEMVIVGSVATSIFIIYNFSFFIWEQNLVVGTVSAAAFFLVVLLTEFRGMGLGDVKLAFFIGLLFGFPRVLVAFWSAFLLGGFFALILLLLKRTKLSATIALGPFLVCGVVVSALWSDYFLKMLGL